MPNTHDEDEIVDGLLSDAEHALAQNAVAKATALYRGILALNPDHVVALRQLAAICVNGGDPRSGLELFQHASTFEKVDPDLYHGIGTALRLLGQTDEALLAFLAALRIDSGHAPALYDMALLERQRGNLTKAAELFRRLAQQGDHFEATFSRAVVLFHQDNLLAAERWFHEAARIKADDPRPFMNLAMIYRVWGFLPQAIACLEHAVILAPDMAEAHWNLANAVLTEGDLARGFAEYEWRFRRPNAAERRFDLPRWDGAPLDGRLLFLSAEQGIGDIIHFIRFAPLVVARGGRVAVECHPGLERLIATVPGVEVAVPWGTAPPADAVTLPIMSLPHILGLTLETIPPAVPYLSVPYGASTPVVDGEGLKVGVVWRGNPAHDNDRWRSVDLNLLAPLLSVPSVSWFSLQRGAGLADLLKAPWAGRIEDLGPQLGDFAATAAAVAALDLVITVDTAVAHVAGALGKRVWVLIPRGNDWRWFHERADSPWYPTMRLFRQRRPRDWAPAIAAMAQDLEDLAGGAAKSD